MKRIRLSAKSTPESRQFKGRSQAIPQEHRAGACRPQGVLPNTVAQRVFTDRASSSTSAGFTRA
jgi:hypothetical protein